MDLTVNKPNISPKHDMDLTYYIENSEWELIGRLYLNNVLSYNCYAKTVSAKLTTIKEQSLIDILNHLLFLPIFLWRIFILKCLQA